ncbi:MAG: hypothetical protein HC915_18825, partial [Anaerolineae bacterium]|nr:hypothetical protein [Anaerolineae bacterium]
MPKRPRHYHRPTDLAEAVRLLDQPGSAPLGGGTRLLAGDVAAETIVDLQALGLDHIDLHETHLHIGATARLYAIHASTEVHG